MGPGCPALPGGRRDEERGCGPPGTGDPLSVDYRTIAPPPDLAEVVEVVWFLSAAADPHAPVDRVLPDGTSEIVLNRADPFEEDDGSTLRVQPPALWVGQMRGPLALRPTGAVDLVGIRIRAEGAGRLLDVPQDRLSGAWFELSGLRPALARALDEALDRGGEDGAVAAALFDALRSCLRPHAAATLASVCRRARASPGATTVDALAREAGMSVRTLERHFVRHVGLTPKRWLRILRFQEVVAEGDTSRDLVDRALRAGYYDQAHFLRDFREFAGTTPGRFFGPGSEERLARAFLEG